MNHVKEVETTFIVPHAVRVCRNKVFKKAAFANDKVSPAEQDLFSNCIQKYFQVGRFSSDSLKEGLLQALQ